jgi:drug/metabolite transporter (DMT)-like permease
VDTPLPAVTSALTVAVSTTVMWGLSLFWFGLLRGIPRASAAPGRSRRSPDGMGWARFFAAVAGMTYVGAILALLAGLQVGDVSQVSPVAATQPLWLVVISSLLAQERRRLDARLVAGAIVVVLGAAWIGTH